MKVVVKILSVDDCKNCKKAKESLKRLCDKNGIKLDLRDIWFLSDEAIDLSVEFGFDEVPSVVIGETPINGPVFSDETLLEALTKNAS